MSTPRATLDFRLHLIERAPFFRGLPPEAHAELATHVGERRAGRKQRILTQGEPARQIFVLCAGWVKITQIAPHGHQVIVRLHGPGETFGALGLALGGTYPSSAEALEPSHAMTWDRRLIEDLTARYPVLLRNAVRILGERVMELERQNRELATAKVPERLAHLLLRLLGRLGRPDEGGALIGLSREDLAQMVGTTLFTVSRLLGQWQARGLLIARREAVLVLNAPGLVSVAEGADPELSAGLAAVGHP